MFSYQIMKNSYLNLFLLKYASCINQSVTVKSRYLEVNGTILQVQITRSANKFALPVIWTCKQFSNAKLWLEKAIKMHF